MDDEWLSARQTIDLTRKSMAIGQAPLAICSRAHNGLIQTRARLLIYGPKRTENVPVPVEFWWSRGKAALTQNWETGDFETWIRDTIHLLAYGVEFYGPDISAMLGREVPIERAPAIPRSGRPNAEWWDGLWVEMCRQLYLGDLKPLRQSDIETAMMDWIIASGFSASESTVRLRARMLWQAIMAEDEK